jgi:hypothetical protein
VEDLPQFNLLTGLRVAACRINRTIFGTVKINQAILLKVVDIEKIGRRIQDALDKMFALLEGLALRSCLERLILRDTSM